MVAKSMKRAEKSGKRLPSLRENNTKKKTRTAGSQSSSKKGGSVLNAHDIDGFARRRPSNPKKGKGKGAFKSKMRHKRR